MQKEHKVIFWPWFFARSLEYFPLFLCPCAFAVNPSSYSWLYTPLLKPERVFLADRAPPKLHKRLNSRQQTVGVACGSWGCNDTQLVTYRCSSEIPKDASAAVIPLAFSRHCRRSMGCFSALHPQGRSSSTLGCLSFSAGFLSREANKMLLSLLKKKGWTHRFCGIPREADYTRQ